jgi:ribosomal protein L17
MQKQYLSAGENKITEYDVKEVQKKLEKMATEAIKNELDNRSRYLVDLLQN